MQKISNPRIITINSPDGHYEGMPEGLSARMYGPRYQTIELTDTTITVSDIHSCNTFELVNEVPLGYMVWNIGANMAPGYLPLCRLCAIQPFEGARNIETDTLKAIKIEGAEYILDAIGHGQDTLEEMEQYVKQYRNSKTDRVKHKVALYRKAIPVMRKIKWN